jgi:hypothetical protein
VAQCFYGIFEGWLHRLIREWGIFSTAYITSRISSQKGFQLNTLPSSPPYTTGIPDWQIILPASTLVFFLLGWFSTLKMRWYIPPKHRLIYGLHGVISQKMVTFTLTRHTKFPNAPGYICEGFKSQFWDSSKRHVTWCSLKQFDDECLAADRTCLQVKPVAMKPWP